MGQRNGSRIDFFSLLSSLSLTLCFETCLPLRTYLYSTDTKHDALCSPFFWNVIIFVSEQIFARIFSGCGMKNCGKVVEYSSGTDITEQYLPGLGLAHAFTAVVHLYELHTYFLVKCLVTNFSLLRYSTYCTLTF